VRGRINENRIRTFRIRTFQRKLVPERAQDVGLFLNKVGQDLLLKQHRGERKGDLLINDIEVSADVPRSQLPFLRKKGHVPLTWESIVALHGPGAFLFHPHVMGPLQPKRKGIRRPHKVRNRR
jgi:hypothetical protein